MSGQFGYHGNTLKDACGDVAVKIQYEVDTVIERIQEATNRVAQVGHDACRIADRIYGPVPEAGMNAGGPNTTGSMSLLQAALDGLDEQVGRAAYQVRRLENL